MSNSPPPRDFITVARIIKNLVPSEYKHFHLEIDSVITSAIYQAPEIYHLLWNRIADLLIELHLQVRYLSKEKLQWEKSVLSVFSDEKLENIVDA
jgi:hypothetical protein